MKKITKSNPKSTSRSGETRPSKTAPGVGQGSDSQAHDKYKAHYSHGMRPGPYNKTV